MQLRHVSPGADSPAYGDGAHSSGTPGWNLLWDMSVAQCAWLAGSHRESSAFCEQSDRASGNKILTSVLPTVTAAKGR